MSLAQKLDLRKLRDDAKLGGFNPVEIIRNGGLAAYMVDYQPQATENGPQELPTGNSGLPAGVLYTDLPDSTLAQGVIPGYRKMQDDMDQMAYDYNEYYAGGGTMGFDLFRQSQMGRSQVDGGGDNEASPGEWELDSEWNATKAQQKMRDTRLGIKRDSKGRVINPGAAAAGFLGNGNFIQSKNMGMMVKLGDFQMVVDDNTPAEEWETEYGGVVGDVAGIIRFMHNMRPGAIKDRENMQAAVGGWLSQLGSTMAGWLPKSSSKPVSGSNGAGWLSDQLDMGNGGEGVTFGKPGHIVYRATEDGGSYYR